MKKLFFALAFIGMTVSTMQAQTEKGNWFFSGNSTVSFTSTKTTPEFDGNDSDQSTTNSTFSFSPDANYFVIDNLAVGLNLAFSSTKSKFEQAGESAEGTANSFNVAPGATYFFGESSTRPFVTAAVGFASTSFGDDDAQKFSGLVYGGGAGVAIFLNDNVAVNIVAEYTRLSLSNKQTSEFKNNSNAIGVGGGFSIFL